MAFISQFDVLCGKDKTYENHSGNRIYRDMIVSVAPQYAATSSKQDKMRMTRDIVSTLIKEHGSRFMKISSVHGGWEEINISAARDKTSHALRFCAAHMTAPTATPSSRKRSSNSKKERRVDVPHMSNKRLRRKVSFDDVTKKNKCVSPDPSAYGTPSYQSHVQESYEQNYNHNKNMNGSLSSWCVPDAVKSIHDLSSDQSVNYYQLLPPPQYGNKTIMPLTSISNSDIDTFWSYQLQDDDEFALIFE